MSSPAFETRFRGAVRRVGKLGFGIVILIASLVLGFGASADLLNYLGVDPDAIPVADLIAIFVGTFYVPAIMVLIYRQAKSHYDDLYCWFVGIFIATAPVSLLCVLPFTKHFFGRDELSLSMSLFIWATPIGWLILVRWHPLTRTISGGSNAGVGDILNRTGRAGYYLFLAIAADFAIYFLFAWEPPPCRAPIRATV
jgi:hypothetical protein